MRNIERHPLFDEPEIKNDIAAHAESIYSPENITTAYINKMFGLEDGDLSQNEIDQLASLFKYTGELLLQSSLEKKSLGNIEEVKQAIREHAEYYSSFKTHDLVHVVTKHFINAKSNTNKIELDSVVPEFLQKHADDVQAMREEFPAVLWTPIGEQRPMFLDLMTGNSDEVSKTLRERNEGKEVDKIETLFKEMDYTDFNSVCLAYTEIVLYLSYKVAQKENELEGNDLEQWKTKFKQSQTLVRQSIQAQLKEFKNEGKFSKNDEGSRTEQLFIEQAHTMFESFNADNKVPFNSFMELSKPFIEKASTNV